jgi:hypothetical protein
LPTRPTTAPRASTPRISLDELKAFRERIARTRLGHSISYMARSRGALGMIHPSRTEPRSNANLQQGIGLSNIITHHDRSDARAGGSDEVIENKENVAVSS